MMASFLTLDLQSIWSFSIINKMQTVQDLHNASNAENDKRVGEVFRTMLGFTILMVLGPIGTYFYTKNYIWESKHQFILNYT